MGLEDIWDSICDSVAYIFSFEWFGDLWELLGSMFENISEFSILGLVFGLIGFGTVFLVKDYMLGPFLKHMGPVESTFWAIATYLGCFAAGYLVGKHFENT